MSTYTIKRKHALILTVCIAIIFLCVYYLCNFNIGYAVSENKISETIVFNNVYLVEQRINLVAEINQQPEEPKKEEVPINRKTIADIPKQETEMPTKQSVPADTNRSYRGISEGQIISGKATHYCACSTCNGSNSGITASGTKIYNGMTNPYIVACNWLPLGSTISVNGITYTVADTGGSGLSPVGRVDIFTPGGHAECYRLGAPKITIEIIHLSKTK